MRVINSSPAAIASTASSPIWTSGFSLMAFLIAPPP
jgi:hypothetical protein